MNEDGKRLAEEALRENAARAEFLEAIRRTGIKTIYANPNKGLERAGKMVEDIVEETLHTSQEIEETITKRMKRGSGILTRDLNKTTPQYEGSGIARFSAMMSSTYKPQSTTSMASIRTYDYKLDVNGDHRTDIPMEYRFGTQGQYHDKQPRVSPLFEDFLEVQQLEREANPPLGPSTRITHIYFNNLGYDRDDMEGKRESRLSMKLHDLEKRHPNVAVITLPADKGMMDKHLLEDHHQSIRVQDAIDDILAIANGTSPRDIKDFHISDDIKQLLYGTDEYSEHGYNTVTENTVLIGLLEETFKKLGVDPDTRATISPAEMQAIYFHFVKYELTNYIIETLKPASFNMSCKDAIDRGGVSSAYYNLMKSLEEGTPISKEEFHRALHAAPTLVKGRGMNHHTKLIWNAVDMYLNGLDKKGIQPEPWMAEWRDKHAPNHTKVRILKDLDDYIGKRDTDQRDKFGMFAKFDKGIKLSAARKLRDLVANPDNNDIEFTPKEWGALNDKRLSKILSEMLKTGFVTKEQIHVQGQEKLSHSM